MRAEPSLMGLLPLLETPEGSFPLRGNTERRPCSMNPQMGSHQALNLQASESTDSKTVRKKCLSFINSSVYGILS